MTKKSAKTVLIILMAGLFNMASARSGESHQRIVSLASSHTMNLYDLGSQDLLVGCTSYCEVAKSDKVPVVASAIKANIEKIVSLNPDLVLATSIVSPETVELLKKFGIRVEVFPTPSSFEELCEQFLTLGSLIGKDEVANRIISETRAGVSRIQKRSAGAKPMKFFIQIGAKPLFAVIPNTFMDDYIRFSNGVNITAGLRKGAITRETVVIRNPEIILIVTMGITGEEEREIWKGFESINAVQNRRIFIIDSNLASAQTPVSFLKTLETIESLLN
ncbi:MAG: helical backbone metal receptor [Bacteroidota bacterium]